MMYCRYISRGSRGLVGVQIHYHYDPSLHAFRNSLIPASLIEIFLTHVRIQGSKMALESSGGIGVVVSALEESFRGNLANWVTLSLDSASAWRKYISTIEA